MRNSSTYPARLRNNRIRSVFLFAALLIPVGFLAAEQASLPTAYPSPSGGYSNIFTTGDTVLARDGGTRVAIGGAAAAAKLNVAGSANITGAISAGNVTSGGKSVIIDAACSGSGLECYKPHGNNDNRLVIDCHRNGYCTASTPGCGQTTYGLDNCGNSCHKHGRQRISYPCTAAKPRCGQTTHGTRDTCGTRCSLSAPPCRCRFPLGLSDSGCPGGNCDAQVVNYTYGHAPTCHYSKLRTRSDGTTYCQRLSGSCHPYDPYIGSPPPPAGGGTCSSNPRSCSAPPAQRGCPPNRGTDNCGRVCYGMTSPCPSIEVGATVSPPTGGCCD